MANEDKPKPPNIAAGVEALKAQATPAPEPTKKLAPEKGRAMPQKTCPKCPDSPVMNAAPVIAIIPAMNDEKFVNVPKISQTAGLPVQAYECPQCHFVELYRAE